MTEELRDAVIDLQSQVIMMQEGLLDMVKCGEKDTRYIEGRIAGMRRALEQIGEAFGIDL